MPSADLPAGFFAAAPLRRTGQLSAVAERRYRHSTTASLSMFRVVALGTAFPWVVFIWLGRITSGGYDAARVVVLLLFTMAALVVIAAAAIHHVRFYSGAFLAAGGAYCAVLAVHVTYILATGSSPLAEMYLGDYAGFPVAMLITALPVAAGLPVAAVVLAVSVVFNLGTPLGFNTVLEIANAELLVLPFMILLLYARTASRLLDEVASNARTLAIRVARTKTLAELETRFLGYLHDRVLTCLDAVNRGVLAADDPAIGDVLRAPPAAHPSSQVAVAGIIAELAQHIPQIAPGITVSVPAEIPEAVTMPANAAAALHDAALEAAQNTVRHAPGAPVYLEVSVELVGSACTGVSVTIRDEGPGFDPAVIPDSRAGVRVAITGRMNAADGCDLQLNTALGKGTTVSLTWRIDGPGATSPKAQVVRVPSAYELAGMGRVFRKRNGVLAWLVFFGLSLNNVHDRPVFYFIALTAAAVMIAALSDGNELRMPEKSTGVAAIGVIIFFVSATIDHSVAAEFWPGVWYLPAFIMMCTYLALRGRAPAAWLVWAICLVLEEILIAAGLGSADIDALSIALMSLALIPATLIPRLLELTTRGLPLALALSRDRAADMETVATQTSFVADSAAWVTGQVTAALDPAVPDSVRRANAGLLELRLRDSIRSPLFDEAAVNRAVWDARARGIAVILLDDRPADTVSDSRIDRLHGELIRLLDMELSGGAVERVTARILPPGRDHYATVVVSGGDDTHRVVVD